MAGIGSRWPLYRRPAPFTPSDEERRQLTHHLNYDIQMTFGLADVLMGVVQTPPPRPPLDQLILNALLESFVVRARTLVEFFWTDRRRHEDALAADYFKPGDWKQMRPDRPQELNRLVTAKVGWGAVHLTYRRARSTPADKQWLPVPMCVALEPTVRLFIDNVDAAQLDPAEFAQIRPCLDGFMQKYGQVTP